MKKTQVAMAALALVASSAAFAADVTVYGNIDAAVVNGDAGTFVSTAGNYQQSRLGFRASEDLGGGLKATANLETGIGGNGGIGGGGIGSSFFNRAANVGINNDSFSLQAGTSLSTFIAAQLVGVTGVGGDGAAVPGLYILNGGNLSQTIASGAANGGFFVANAVTASVTAGGLTFAAQTRALGTSSADKFMAAHVSGSFNGLNFAIAHQDITNAWSVVSEGSPNAFRVKQRNTMIAANTMLGAVRVNAAWSRNAQDDGDTNGGMNLTTNGYLLGASMPLTGNISGGITFAKNSNSQAYGNVEMNSPGYMATRMVSASANYALSKSAFAYATYTNFNIATGIPDNAGAAGATKNVVSVGLVKSF